MDLLSDGFAVLPPSSTHREPNGGGPYRWVQGHNPRNISLAELLDLPLGLLGWWQQCSDRNSLGVNPGNTAKAGAWQLLEGPILEGSRNDSLTRIAGWLRLYHPAPVVAALLLTINDARCQPPLDASEVGRIVRSVFKYCQAGVNGHPRAVVPSFIRGEVSNG